MGKKKTTKEHSSQGCCQMIKRIISKYFPNAILCEICQVAGIWCQRYGKRDKVITGDMGKEAKL
jgi:hypothetical protein